MGQLRKSLVPVIRTYSALMPAALMIGHHFSISDRHARAPHSNCATGMRERALFVHRFTDLYRQIVAPMTVGGRQ